MNKITIDVTGATTKDQVHDIIKESLSFPEYYGKNLDALHDLISTLYIKDRVEFELIGFNKLPEDISDFGKKIVTIFKHVSASTYKVSNSSIFIVKEK